MYDALRRQSGRAARLSERQSARRVGERKEKRRATCRASEKTHYYGKATPLLVAMRAALLMLTSIAAPCRAINSFLRNRFEPFAKVALERYLADTLPASSLTWIADGPGGSTQLAFWRWLLEADTLGAQSSVLALPSHEPREVRQLLEIADLLPAHYQVVPLPDASPVPGLAALVQPPSEPEPVPAPGADGSAATAVTARTAAWVDRTLSPSGLRFCPYTQSSDISGYGLEGYGVSPAPIMYVHCGGTSLPALLESFWSSAAAMRDAGEEGVSSIILAAPEWDSDFEAWSSTVFPLLEESVLVGKLGRELGIVCFHPHYSTPSDAWLARHRFGHMHSPTKLRAYVREHDERLAEEITDDELLWAGSYQRRSPHATINVLWARQLEQAEQKRKSSLLYTRNLQRALGEGQDVLDAAAAAERSS